MKHTKRLNLRSLNLRSRRRMDRWLRIEVGYYFALYGQMATWDKDGGYRFMTLADINDEWRSDGR